ncbi:CSMD [Mytilus coruscus]|uniref:CSMD n=1 Tax=Mytilus coruscus TaxID=42192 RepID=A0A6J8EJC9_MYTCO|nr:CSMD [Mytilus coruscus]
MHIPFNLARRICTIVFKLQIRLQELKPVELKEMLLEREYPETIIDNGIERANVIHIQDLRTPQQNTNIHDVYSWNPPSFISNWYSIESQNSENATLTIIHSLGELPAKVDIQIKVIIVGVDYIFTGIGSAQRDNDYAHDYGGVVYIYNSAEIVLSLPFGGYHQSGGVAYTGSHLDYNGPSSPVQGKHDNGFVRVKAWKEADFPTPLFREDIQISDNYTDNFKEIDHKSSVLPHLVTAQTRLYNGYYSDGQGVIFQEKTDAYHNCLGGLLFSYSKTKVRMWVPDQDPSNIKCNGAVFMRMDGWGGNTLISNTGTVVLKGYKLDEHLVFETTVRVNDRISSQDIVYPSLYNIDHALVTVQVKHDENGGNNQGMIFDGAGTALSTDNKYSGVIYVYTNSSILLWTPSTGNGYMIFIDDRWGSQQMTSAETSADVIVRVYAVSSCSTPDSVAHAQYTVMSLRAGGTVTYKCDTNYEHNSGSLVRICQSNETWNGTLPTCKEIECPDPASSNSNYTISNGLIVGSVVTYFCYSGYLYTSGYLSRTCQSNGRWDGTDPVCSQMQCLHPDGIANGSYVFTEKSVGDTVTYTCNVHYQYEAGDLERTCQLGGYWDGIPPVCSVIKCPDPGGVFNATYRVAGFAPGNTATYTCVVGSMHQAGDSIRVCQSDGSWNGIPIVCYTAGLTTFHPVAYTPHELAEHIKRTKKELTVDKKTTSSYARKLVCATDSRPSATYIGTGGVVLFCSILASVILPDIITFIRHIQHMSNIYRRQK